MVIPVSSAVSARQLQVNTHLAGIIVTMERCDGSHMRCTGCGCPCHGTTQKTRRTRRVTIYKVPEERRMIPTDLPVDALKAASARGESISKLALHYGCDRRTIAVALGKYPPCSNGSCHRFSRRTSPDLCRECFKA